MTTYGYRILGRDGHGDLTVPVTVVATKSVYGHDRVQITPVGGSGKRWVDASKLLPLRIPCPDCDGSGQTGMQLDGLPLVCATCGGNGRAPTTTEDTPHA
jgi:hypothetical protein